MAHKTVKYYVSFSSVDTDMSTDIEISKAQYEAQLNKLCNQINDTKENECPVEELTSLHREHTPFTEDILFFTCGCATVTLTKLSCKEGYYFKPQK